MPAIERLGRNQRYSRDFYDGSKFWVELEIVPVADETGWFTHWVCVQRDITERKQAEQKLCEMTSLYQQILDAIPDLVLCKEPESKIIYANKAFRDYYGMTQEQLQGIIDAPFVNPDYTQQYVQDDAYVFNTGQTLTIEEPVVRYDGQERLFSTVKSAIKDTQGQVIQTVGVSRDITEQKLAQERLRLLERAIAASNNGIIISEAKAPNNPIIYVNSGFERMTGYQKDQVIGSQCCPFDRTYATPTVLDELQRALAEGRETQVTLRSSRVDGTPFWSEFCITPVRDATDNLTHFIGVQTDISDRKQVEDALRQSEERLQLALEGSGMGLWDWKINTGQIYFNSQWKAMLGYEVEEIENSFLSWERLVHPEDLPRADIMQQLGLKSVLIVRTSYQGKPNGIICLEQCDRFRYWTDDEIELLESVAVQMGIAIAQANLLEKEKQRRQELAAQNQALEKATLEAEAANLAKSLFFSKMSHELRTPLNAILGFTQVMTRSASVTTEQTEHLEIINHSGEHLLELINDILSMSKIEAGQVTLNENRFDLYGLLNSLEEMLRLKAISKGLKLIFERTTDVPQYVQTDESKLRQVLINLLGNAIKFTQAGSVTLRVGVGTRDWGVGTSKENHSVPYSLLPTHYFLTFEVKDTGLGIAPDELDTLFDPFVQTETGRQSMEGTGLGLSISQQFVRLMGGDITVSSQLSISTIFTFDIQVNLATKADEKPISRSQRRVIGLEPNQPSYRLLIVEDAAINRKLLIEILKPLGFEVRIAVNGQEGVSLWESWSPHLILMDILMPVMDGYEATQQIKQLSCGDHLKERFSRLSNSPVAII